MQAVVDWFSGLGLGLLYAIGWIEIAFVDLILSIPAMIIWIFASLWWFIQWLPARLTGQTEDKLPVGDNAEVAFDHINDKLGGFFDTLSDGLNALIDGILWVLVTPPPLVTILVFVLIAYAMQRSWKIALLVLVGFLFILDQDYWEETMRSLTLVLSACLVCMGVGVPIGIACAHRPRLYRAIVPLLDLMQTLPTFVYLIPAIVFFGTGVVPGLIATVIFVLPAPIRLTYLGVSSTPTALLEAAQAFGATKQQVLWKVELPSALPQIMAGLNQTIMLSLSMVVIAALVGANGLGVPVMRALGQVNTALGFESGFIIVVVAIMLDRMLRVTRT
jgi:glycine betaine/proline transport system permease protein